jgi:hypothetical protein
VDQPHLAVWQPPKAGRRYVIGGDGTILYQHIGDIRAEHVPMLLDRLKAAK